MLRLLTANNANSLFGSYKIVDTSDVMLNSYIFKVTPSESGAYDWGIQPLNSMVLALQLTPYSQTTLIAALH